MTNQRLDIPATTAINGKKHTAQAFASIALKTAAVFWFVVAAIGQLMFVYYLLFLYGAAAARGDWLVLNKVMPHGYVPGDSAGNFAIVLHIFLAVIIVIGGLIQLLPMVRQRAPALHRWNGRVFLLAVCTTSLAGLYMLWIRGSVGDLPQHLGSTFGAMLIWLCAFMALRHALARQIAVHRRWALRLYLVANAVWFYRIGLMFWILLNHGPAGFDPDTFTGPTLNVLSFAQTLLPLAVLEVYFAVQRHDNAVARIAFAAGLLLLTVAMGVGIFGALMGMWLPKM
jgi:uncharacterized membrane protein